MAKFLVQAAYTPEAWATLVKNPQDRKKAVEPMIKDAGGKIEAFYFAFGQSDAVLIIDVPDNVSAAAISVAAAAGGALKSITTTPLLSVEDGLAVMKKAGKLNYQAPG
jgi:uncharacterized protein with GYD domain